MITYEAALKKAKQIKPNIDNCTEYENGFIFGSTEDEGYDGGAGRVPIVIKKSDGKVTMMGSFISAGTGKKIKDMFMIK